jgi:hypothetical protein
MIYYKISRDIGVKMAEPMDGYNSPNEDDVKTENAIIERGAPSVKDKRKELRRKFYNNNNNNNNNNNGGGGVQHMPLPFE